MRVNVRHVCTFDIPKGMTSRNSAGIGDMPGDFQPTDAMILESPDLVLMWMWAPERKSGLSPEALCGAKKHQPPAIKRKPGGPSYRIMGSGFGVADSIQEAFATVVNRHRLMYVRIWEPVRSDPDSMKTRWILDSIRWLSDGE